MARGAVASAAGVMAAGFVDWPAGVLVAGLTVLTYVLLATVEPRIPAITGLRRALRALRGGGYRVIEDGARYVAVGPGGVYLLMATQGQAQPRGPEDWSIGGRSAARIAERLAGQAARVDHMLAGELGRTGGFASASIAGSADANTPHRQKGGTAPAPAAVAVILVAGRRPESVTRLGRVLLARPRSAARHILAQGDVLAPERAERIAERIERMRPGPNR